MPGTDSYAYTLEDAERDIAALIGKVDRLSEVLTKNDSTDPPAIPAAGIIHHSFGGQHKYASADGSYYNTGNHHVFGTPAQSVGTTSSTNAITGSSALVGIGTYHLDAVVWCTNGATNANQSVGFNGPTASVINVENSLAYTQLTANPIQLGESRQTGYGATLGVSGNGQTLINATDTFVVKLRGYLTFSAAGTFTLCAACLTLAADTFTVNAFEYDLSPVT